MTLLRFVLKLFYWLMVVLAVTAAVVIAVSNRHDVILSFAPFPVDVALPLYLVIFSGICIGLVSGLIVGGWSTARRWRRKQRRAEAGNSGDKPTSSRIAA